MVKAIKVRSHLPQAFVRFRTYWNAHWVSCIVVILILAGMVATTRWAQRASELSHFQAASAQARDVARQLAERTSQLVRRADQLSSLAASEPGRFTARELLVDGTEHSAVLLVDRAGRVTDSTLLPVGTDVSTLPYFQKARTGTVAELGLLAPLRLVPHGPVLLPTIRRVQSADGTFAGAVIIAVQASHITETSHLPAHPDALFALLDDKGQVLAGAAGGAPLSTSKIDPRTWGALQTQSSAPVVPRVSGPGDAKLRFSAVAKVAPYPLAVLVGVPVSSATSDTQLLFRAVYAAVLLLGAAVVAAAMLAQRQHHRLQVALNNRELAEAALWEEKEFLAVTLGSIDDAVVTLDRQNRVTFMNRRAEAMTGWMCDEALGHDLHQVVTLHEIPDVAELDAFSGCATAESSPPLWPGTWVPMESHASPVQREVASQLNTP